MKSPKVAPLPQRFKVPSLLVQRASKACRLSVIWIWKRSRKKRHYSHKIPISARGAACKIASAQSLGHFLKGSSATPGLTKVKDSCEKIQHYGARKDEHGNATNKSDVQCLELVILLALKGKFNADRANGMKELARSDAGEGDGRFIALLRQRFPHDPEAI